MRNAQSAPVLRNPEVVNPLVLSGKKNVSEWKEAMPTGQVVDPQIMQTDPDPSWMSTQP